MESNEVKVEDPRLNADVEIPELPKPKPQSLRRQRQQLLARLKFQTMSMQGNLGPLRHQLRQYNNNMTERSQKLTTLERDLTILQNYLSDVLLEINEKFAIMKLETFEKKNQPK